MNSRDINLWKKILSRIAENRLKIFDKYTVRYCNTNKNNKGKKKTSQVMAYLIQTRIIFLFYHNSSNPIV